MDFHIVGSQQHLSQTRPSSVYLHIDHWNDYSFFTLFRAVLIDNSGFEHNLGMVKIGFKGQTAFKKTRETLGTRFPSLPDGYFSLGVDVDYYQKIANLHEEEAYEYLVSMKDVVHNQDVLEYALDEEVFNTSLLRGVSLNTIRNQFSRVLHGNKSFTTYKFKYLRHEKEGVAGVELNFEVIPQSKPNTNIHALIGKNGVGKTKILNGIQETVITRDRDKGVIYKLSEDGEQPISEDYFGRLISVSFSLFDPFTPPIEQPDPSKGLCYFYIGFKKPGEENKLKTLPLIHNEILDAIDACFSEDNRKKQWVEAIKILESDSFFLETGLSNMERTDSSDLRIKAKGLINNLSSGHTIILHTISNLVAKVEANTLVLIDEPESHLHPPLLSAFIRALSQLLKARNGVAVIATHSPVVLQEVPSSCVSVLQREEDEMAVTPPGLETFGENIGVLTREVFGLEVLRSGFHQLLNQSVNSGKSYKETVSEYNNQLGSEARALLQSLVIGKQEGS